MQIRVIYFAQLAELAGKSEETRELIEHSPAALYTEIRATYQLPYELTSLLIAPAPRHDTLDSQPTIYHARSP